MSAILRGTSEAFWLPTDGPCLAMFGRVWLCLAMFCYVWLCMVTCALTGARVPGRLAARPTLGCGARVHAFLSAARRGALASALAHALATHNRRVLDVCETCVPLLCHCVPLLCHSCSRTLALPHPPLPSCATRVPSLPSSLQRSLPLPLPSLSAVFSHPLTFRS